MSKLPIYSSLLTCLHDEPDEYGYLGRGTHYSVFRTAEWFDVCRRPLVQGEIHDFAIVWDEDHDTRVIEAVERIYMAGLLSPVQFIGERKGSLTVIVAAKFYWHVDTDIDDYKRQVQEAIKPLDDYWPVEVGMFDRAGARHADWHQTDPCGLINDKEYKVNVYMANIDSIWNLGTKPPVWPRSSPPGPPLPGASTGEI